MQFTFNEGHIQLPSQWQDQSMQVLVSTDNSGINLVITPPLLHPFPQFCTAAAWPDRRGLERLLERIRLGA